MSQHNSHCMDRRVFLMGMTAAVSAPVAAMVGIKPADPYGLPMPPRPSTPDPSYWMSPDHTGRLFYFNGSEWIDISEITKL